MEYYLKLKHLIRLLGMADVLYADITSNDFKAEVEILVPKNSNITALKRQLHFNVPACILVNVKEVDDEWFLNRSDYSYKFNGANYDPN